jgi:UDP-N-acetylmuramoyl-tripeptide--D-alanyl-D-alanine ligase
MLTLGHFLRALLPDYRPTGGEPPVSRVVVDSRRAQSGAVFAAFSGEQADGHDYVADAFSRGAIAALVERPLPGDYLIIDVRRPDSAPRAVAGDKPALLVVEDVMAALQQTAKTWRAQLDLRVIGVTGSVGKTTTKELTHSVLSQRYRTLKSPGNRNNEIGLPLALLALRPSHQRAVLEMAMYAMGEIALLCELAQPAVGVVTMIGPVHLERVGSMEGIVRAKRELVEALPGDGVAILNRDDRRVMSMADHTAAAVFTYGLNSNADLWASHIQSMGLEGVRFTLNYGRETLSVQVPLLGRHSVHTALRAAAVGLVEGLSWEEIVAGLNETRSQLRLVAVPGPDDSIIIDDTYNSSPDSVMAALNLLKDLEGRRVAVLGDMLELGQMEEQSHRLVGRRAAEVADVLLAVGERGRWIGEEALQVGMSPLQVHMADDAATAVAQLTDLIRPRDIILVKASYSMGLDQIVAALGRDG